MTQVEARAPTTVNSNARASRPTTI
jgi:hypothetical protein